MRPFGGGSEGSGGGAQELLEARGTDLEDGTNSLAGLADKFLIKMISIETTSRDWIFTIYSRGDYSTDPVTLLSGQSEGCLLYLDHPYTDRDGGGSLHYWFIDASGAGATYSIIVLGSRME